MEKTSIPTPVPTKKFLHTILLFLRSQLLYIGGYIFFICLLIFFVPQTITEYSSLKVKVAALEKEVSKVQTDTSYIEAYANVDTKTLIQSLNRLVPAKEDFFSAITAVNQYANKNGTPLLTHTSPFKSKESTKVQVTMTLLGDMKVLESFLTDYHYKSGRYMTVDAFTFKQLDNKISLDVSFYSQPSVATPTRKSKKSALIGPPDKKLIDEVLSLDSANLQSQSAFSVQSTDTSYTSTVNPFFNVTPTTLPTPTVIVVPTENPVTILPTESIPTP